MKRERSDSCPDVVEGRIYTGGLGARQLRGESRTVLDGQLLPTELRLLALASTLTVAVVVLADGARSTWILSALETCIVNVRSIASVVGQLFAGMLFSPISLISQGLRYVADGLQWASTRIANFLYDRGYYKWSRRVRVVGRYIYRPIRLVGTALGFVDTALTLYDTYQTVYRVLFPSPRAHFYASYWR